MRKHAVASFSTALACWSARAQSVSGIGPELNLSSRLCARSSNTSSAFSTLPTSRVNRTAEPLPALSEALTAHLVLMVLRRAGFTRGTLLRRLISSRSSRQSDGVLTSLVGRCSLMPWPRAAQLPSPADGHPFLEKFHQHRGPTCLGAAFW